MSFNEDLPACTWELIEEILSQPTENRTDEDIFSILPWFKERSSLFHALGEDSLMEVVRFSQLMRVKIDNVFVHQGEKGDCFYIVLRGSVAVHAKKLERSENGSYEPVLHDVLTAKSVKDRARFGQELCLLKAGRCFGELSVISKNNERNATIITDEACVLISIHREVYMRYVSDQFAVEIIRRSSFVGTHPLFRSWPTAYRNILAENLQMRYLKYGDILAKQGDPLESIYFVLEGQVQLTANPVLHETKHANTLAKICRQSTCEEDDDDEFGQTKPLNIIERRKLRKEYGFFALEQRYREVDICTIGQLGIIGDIEAIMDLNSYTSTATCIQELKAYEIDLYSFTKIILKKNPETNEKMKRAVEDKLNYRAQLLRGAIPIYITLLSTFDKPKPKDNRKKMIKNFLAKKENKKPVRAEFFEEMSRGVSHNREQGKQHNKHSRFSVREAPVVQNTQVIEDAEQNKIKKKELWKKTGKFAAKMNISLKNQQNGTEQKQFTADEYKQLKKQMQALGKSAANTKKLNI